MYGHTPEHKIVLATVSNFESWARRRALAMFPADAGSASRKIFRAIPSGVAMKKLSGERDNVSFT
jgi:hypothetical protein